MKEGTVRYANGCHRTKFLVILVNCIAYIKKIEQQCEM